MPEKNVRATIYDVEVGQPASTSPADRPLRADAARNRDRVLEAAREAFAEKGVDVAVAEIAKRAGVGAGTLFRHFATKEDLLVAVLERTFDDLAVAVEQALETDDPWDGVVRVFTLTAEMQARDRMFLESVGPELFGHERLVDRNQKMMEQMVSLLVRAQDAGAVRKDVAAEDLPFLIAAIGGSTQQCSPGGAVGLPDDLWQRYLTIVLDGLRPQGATPLPSAPPTREQLMAAKHAKHAAGA